MMTYWGSQSVAGFYLLRKTDAQLCDLNVIITARESNAKGTSCGQFVDRQTDRQTSTIANKYNTDSTTAGSTQESQAHYNMSELTDACF